MRYLLDTHTFIWLDDGSEHLSTTVKNLIAVKTNTILLSYVTIFEMQIKIGVGKMAFPVSLAQKIQLHFTVNSTELLPITLNHIYRMAELPLHHGDPFDRLLIAQALEEGVPILSRDSQFSKYPITTIW
jgi:PIN domain nuclease of toxin-antitoxin system